MSSPVTSHGYIPRFIAATRAEARRIKLGPRVIDQHIANRDILLQLQQTEAGSKKLVVLKLDEQKVQKMASDLKHR